MSHKRRNELGPGVDDRRMQQHIAGCWLSDGFERRDADQLRAYSLKLRHFRRQTNLKVWAADVQKIAERHPFSGYENSNKLVDDALENV